MWNYKLKSNDLKKWNVDIVRLFYWKSSFRGEYLKFHSHSAKCSCLCLMIVCTQWEVGDSMWSYTACACVTSPLSPVCVWGNKHLFSRLSNSAFFQWQQVRGSALGIICDRVLHDCLCLRKSFMCNIFQFVPKSFCEYWSRWNTEYWWTDK